jgi:hypothetical protein
LIPAHTQQLLSEALLWLLYKWLSSLLPHPQLCQYVKGHCKGILALLL